ncbi:hypothetical protein NQ318_023080 [Aromia moschata]|uniref:Uncharacterized protein n=1 Tax=Aromia moschata TaxID=1265417 RepID=A0AAV8XLJ8_9CUCU|nr:hypothetical protein NQ318_023080 [Aromia moschata]
MLSKKRTFWKTKTSRSDSECSDSFTIIQHIFRWFRRYVYLYRKARSKSYTFSSKTGLKSIRSGFQVSIVFMSKSSIDWPNYRNEILKSPLEVGYLVRILASKVMCKVQGTSCMLIGTSLGHDDWYLFGARRGRTRFIFTSPVYMFICFTAIYQPAGQRSTSVVLHYFKGTNQRDDILFTAQKREPLCVAIVTELARNYFQQDGAPPKFKDSNDYLQRNSEKNNYPQRKISQAYYDVFIIISNDDYISFKDHSATLCVPEIYTLRIVERCGKVQVKYDGAPTHTYRPVKDFMTSKFMGAKIA